MDHIDFTYTKKSPKNYEFLDPIELQIVSRN